MLKLDGTKFITIEVMGLKSKKYTKIFKLSILITNKKLGVGRK